MTAKEYMKSLIDDAEFQLRKAIEGLTDDRFDAKATEAMMSTREVIVHLAEAYTATLAHLAGVKHEWGKFQLTSETWDAQVSEAFALRDQAVNALLSASDEADALKTGHLYIIAHDFYHVGQLCSSRITLEPAWDAFSIYNF